MNKQELIEKYVYMKRNLEMWVRIPDILEDLKQLDEPERVKVPKFIADCIEFARSNHWDLEDVFKEITSFSDDSEIYKWLYDQENMNILARAWLDGYEVEQEKRYLVEMKGVAGYGRYLNKALSSGEYFFASENEVGLYKTKHTKKELENFGFGWVFNCPGVKVKEVK